MVPEKPPRPDPGKPKTPNKGSSRTSSPRPRLASSEGQPLVNRNGGKRLPRRSTSLPPSMKDGDDGGADSDYDVQGQLATSKTLYASAHLHEARRFLRAESLDNIDDQDDKHSLRGTGSINDVEYGAASSQDGHPPDDASVDSKSEKKSCVWTLSSELRGVYEILVGNWINLLLVFIPLAQLSVVYQWGDSWIFMMNFLAMIPLAAMLGDFTEAVADRLGETMAGLMNASFGNAPEIIFSYMALQANEIRVVQASLVGSILSNLLLVLGSSFLAGGLFSGKKELTYNRKAAVANTSLLLMSSLAILLPTPIAKYYDDFNTDVLLVSRITACFMLFMYLQLLVFQLKTHAHLFNQEDEDDDEEEDESLSVYTSIFCLATLTMLVGVFSDNLVDSIDGFTKEMDLSKTFVGIILIPIIGNVVEHIVAVTVAVKGKMELSMGIAVGSATQVSMFVIPLTVIVGWGMGRDFTLNLPDFEVALYALCILLVSHMLSSGSSNWLEGSMLVSTYFMVAVAFWFEKVKRYRDLPPVAYTHIP